MSGVIQENRMVKAVALSVTQLQMLDIGAPVVIACETLTGETVAVRLQTRVLANAMPGALPGDVQGDGVQDNSAGAAAASWVTHGAYVAVMPAGVDYGC